MVSGHLALFDIHHMNRVNACNDLGRDDNPKYRRCGYYYYY